MPSGTEEIGKAVAFLGSNAASSINGMGHFVDEGTAQIRSRTLP